MRVKRLEIQGFKSFKDKTVIHFDHTITGIVGPNGCGKSNIVDAFFWVMGEQSIKHMRGNASSDLIFNGSSKYASLNMAEATLVLETPDVTEITSPAPSENEEKPAPLVFPQKEISVTRRMYRTGESEYFMNGKPSRLKDIHELFMDTGVGTKGYSVIEQGQIGKIVNAKPEERRLLIEEAAGIAKYKSRKKESLRKMETASNNLMRLSDIIAEIEKNVEILEKSAQKARKAQKAREELQGIELITNKVKLIKLEKELQEVNEQLQQLTDHNESGQNQLSIQQTQIETLKIELLDKTKHCNDLTQRMEGVGAQLAEKRKTLELSRQRKDHLLEKAQALEQERIEFSEEQDTLTQHIATLAAQTQQLDEQSASFQDTYADLQERLHDKKALLQQQESAQATHSQKAQAVEKSIIQAESFLQSHQQQVNQFVSKMQGLEEEKICAQEKLTTIEEEAGLLLEQIDVLKGSIEDLAVHLTSWVAQGKDAKRELQELQKHKVQESEAFAQARARLNTQKELLETLESLDGIKEGPKKVAGWLALEKKPAKLILDCLDLEPGYELMVTSFLESHLETIWCPDRALAKEIMAYAHEHKHGIRVQIRQPAITHAPLAEGFKHLRPLSSVIRGSTSFLDLHQGLTNVWIIDTMDFVWGLFDSTEQAILEKHSFVTQEGTGWIAPGFLIRPASEKTPYIGHLTRKSELESLTHLVQEKQQALSAIEASITTVADRIADIEMQIRNSADEKIAMEKQLLQHQTKIEQQERMQKDLCSQLQRICLKIDQEQALLESLNEQAVEINDRLEGLKEEQKTMQEVQESGQIAKEQQQAELDALTAQFQSLHIQKATSAERLQASLRELTAQEQQLTRVQRRLVEINQMLARNEQMEQGLEDSDESLTQSIQELSDALQVLRQSYQEFQNQSEILNQQMTTLSESVKDLQKSDTARQQKLLQLQVQNERLLAGQTRITDGLIERYGNAILEQIATASPSEQDFEPKQASHNQKQLDALKEQLAELGEVNFASIREYDEAKQRFEHLSQERKDLQDSLLHLEQAIEHINKTSEQRFEQAFKAIAERFEKLFPIIFGGGHARLQLVAKEGSTDPADLGVDILAQPPGKKVSNITLLSGGEKALTAVSLIFAIFMVKPSPFCVLDEVDAPLDDANIGRFNALLREMSHKSQFILITHNKKTMELNNTLYGVTMEEPGVSKMVSIQLH